jgi:hypothetical protein
MKRPTGFVGLKPGDGIESKQIEVANILTGLD